MPLPRQLFCSHILIGNNMERTYKTAAIALGQKQWRNDDLLFYFFTREFGRVESVATGARKIKSKLAGHLASPGIVEIIFINGKAQKKLTHAYLIKKYSFDSEQDWYYYNCLLELLVKSLPVGEKNDLVWKLLMWSLENIGLQNTDEGKKMILNLFIIKLMTILGYEISFDRAGTYTNRFSLPDQIRQTIENIQQKTSNPRISISRENVKKMAVFLRKYLAYYLERPIHSLENVV